MPSVKHGGHVIQAGTGAKQGGVPKTKGRASARLFALGRLSVCLVELDQSRLTSFCPSRRSVLLP
jgi:hypothetical protein